MCGRYTTGTEEENVHFKEIIEQLNEGSSPENAIIMRENGDVYPGDFAPVIVTDSSESVYRGMRWGFETNGRLVINARSETVLEKPMFKHSIECMRCLVPIMGYYEWNARKEKFLFTDPNGEMLLLAGLYRYSTRGINEFTILTREAYGSYSDIHSRMPLIIRERDMWLHDNAKVRQLLVSGNDIKLDAICQSPQQLSMF